MRVEPSAPGLTDGEKLRRLPWAFAHIAANAIFCQLTVFGPVFILFLTELGLDKVQIGLLLAFFPLAGAVAPLVAPLVARLGYKRVFVVLWIRRFFWNCCRPITSPNPRAPSTPSLGPPDRSS
jgi:MFS family permease